MKSFHSSVTDLRQPFAGTVETFGYECGWADEAIFFVTAERQTPADAEVDLRVQLSADGVRWLDEGSGLRLAGPGEEFVRVRHFGGFLRLVGVITGPDPRSVLTVRLALKG
jgi:hypothetical protein